VSEQDFSYPFVEKRLDGHNLNQSCRKKESSIFMKINTGTVAPSKSIASFFKPTNQFYQTNQSINLKNPQLLYATF